MKIHNNIHYFQIFSLENHGFSKGLKPYLSVGKPGLQTLGKQLWFTKTLVPSEVGHHCGAILPYSQNPNGIGVAIATGLHNV